MSEASKARRALRDALAKLAPDHPGPEDRQAYATVLDCARAAAEASAGEAAALAAAIAAIADGVARHTINPAYAVPLMAASAEALCGSYGGDETALRAARFELETLMPLPREVSKTPVSAPFDVATKALNRKSKS